MIRLLFLLLGMLTTTGVGRRRQRYVPDEYEDTGAWPVQPRDDGWRDAPDRTRVLWRERPEPPGPGWGTGTVAPRRRRRRRVPLWAKWATALAVAGLIFRKAVAFAVLTALSAALHLVGLNVH
jgi:hypothetical protein